MARLPKGTRVRNNGYERRFTVEGVQYSVYGKTLKELDEKEFNKRKELEEGSYSKNRNITLDKYFTEWIQEREKRIKPNTIYGYKNIYKNHIAPKFGKRKIKDIEKREIRQYMNKAIKEGEAAPIMNRTLLVLHAILKDCVNDGIIKVNPAEGIKKIKDERPAARETKHRAMTEEEQSLFMQEMQNEYYYEFVAFMLCTGMRAGEVSALTWSNVDEVNRVIHVKETLTFTKDGKITTGTPKSKAGERDIPLTDTALQLLRKAKDKNIIVNGEALAFNKHIFFSPSGAIVSNEAVNRAISRTIKRLNAKGYKFEKLTSHAMRDTFATRYIEQGGTPQTLKAILGHSSLAMTMDLYAHVLPNTKAEEMNRISISI